MLLDLTVQDTRFAACLDQPERLSCFFDGVAVAGGDGITIADRCTATLSNFSITGSAMAGLHVTSRGSAKVSHGIISGNELGLNVESGDPLRNVLTDEVYVFDNRSADYARAEMPIPDVRGGVLGPEE